MKIYWPRLKMGLIETIEKQGKCEIVVVEKGLGLQTPNEGSTCRVRLKRFQQDVTAIEDGEKEIVIGEGTNELSETLDKCLLCMHQGAIWQVKGHSEHDQNHKENKTESLSSLPSTIQYELKLLSFTKEKRWREAARQYSRALKQLIMMKGKDSDEQTQEYNQLKLSCHLNLAACQGRLQQFDYVVQNCTKVLIMDADNIKGLYRRGQAHLMLNEYKKAKKDLEKALKLEPANRAVQEQLVVLREKQRQQDAAYAKALAAMFGRT